MYNKFKLPAPPASVIHLAVAQCYMITALGGDKFAVSVSLYVLYTLLAFSHHD